MMPGVITINPSVFGDKRDAMAVAVNEGLRLFMEDMKFEPKFDITPEQEKFFAGTAYEKDEDAMRKTIVARIATFDTSVSPTPEQTAETRRLLGLVTEALGPKHPDYEMVKKMDELLAAGGPGVPEPEAPAATGGTAQDDMKGGNVMEDPVMNGTVSKVLDALETVESNRNPNAVGDQGRAVGILQMWPIAVDEANRLAGKKLWSYEDRKNPQLSRAMGKLLLESHYKKGVTDPTDLGLRWRNPNPNKKSAPQWYADKVKKALGVKIAEN